MSMCGFVRAVAVLFGCGLVYVGGDCGKMIHRTTGGTWEELKSQTSFHVYGMSIPSAAGGFVTASARAEAVVLAKLP